MTNRNGRNGEWVVGRYEAEKLAPDAPRPIALLYTRNNEKPLRLAEFSEARFQPRR